MGGQLISRIRPFNRPLHHQVPIRHPMRRVPKRLYHSSERGVRDKLSWLACLFVTKKHSNWRLIASSFKARRTAMQTRNYHNGTRIWD